MLNIVIPSPGNSIVIQSWDENWPLPENAAIWPDNLDTTEFYNYNGFVNLVIDNNKVISYTPNIESWQNYKDSLPPITEPEPTVPDRVAELESKNKLLEQQISALSSQNEFQEELIVELANIVYA